MKRRAPSADGESGRVDARGEPAQVERGLAGSGRARFADRLGDTPPVDVEDLDEDARGLGEGESQPRLVACRLRTRDREPESVLSRRRRDGCERLAAPEAVQPGCVQRAAAEREL